MSDRYGKPAAVAVLADHTLSRQIYKPISEVPKNTEPVSLKKAFEWSKKDDIGKHFDIVVISFASASERVQVSTEIATAIKSQGIKVVVCSSEEDYLKELEAIVDAICLPGKLNSVLNRMLYHVPPEVISERITRHTSQKQVGTKVPA